MKPLHLFLLLFLSVTSAISQTIPIDPSTDKFKYDIIVQTDELKQEEIYDRAKDWIIRTLKSSDNLINLDDVNKTAINATGNILLSDQDNGLVRYRNVSVNFKFNVYCKNGKYKVIIDNFILNYELVVDRNVSSASTSLEGGYKKQGVFKGQKATEKTYIETDEALQKLIEALKSTIAAGKLPGDNGDW